MPPARSRAGHDDSRSETSAPTSAKPPTISTTSKDNRRPAPPPPPPPPSTNGPHAHSGIEGMDWDSLPLSVLRRYRHAYKMPSQSSSSKGFPHLVLSAGVGKKAPSRAAGGRGDRNQLATNVRKNFNAQPVVENEVIVNFLYSVKMQDKHFRMQFPPGKKGSGGATVVNVAAGVGGTQEN